MNPIARFRKTLDRWGLTEIPFLTTPPEDPVLLSRLFHGRQHELDLALPALYEGRNILVRGLWGVGKTTFMLHLLHQLQRETAALEEPMLIRYIGRFPGETSESLYQALLFPLSEALADIDSEARRVRNAISGLQVTDSHQSRIEGKVDLKFLSLSGSKGREQEREWKIQNAYPSAPYI